MVDDLLDRIGFTAAELRHPVDLLTVELVAGRAGIPVTSLDSAIESADALRRGVLEATATSLVVTPGPASWAAMRETLAAARKDQPTDGLSGDALQPLLAARAQELADDPAFPFLLSAFDWFDAPELGLIARQTLRSVFRQFWPFLVTVCDGSTLRCPEEPTARVEGVVTALLTADAYRRLLGATAADDEQEVLLTGIMARAIAFAMNVDDPTAPQVAEDWVVQDTIIMDRTESGRALEAKRAGAEIMLGHELAFTTSIGVSEARRRTGLSNAGFYKNFGSVHTLDQMILHRAHREIAEGFRDEFFATALESLRSGDIEAAGSRFAANLERYQRDHANNGRPGRQLTPWLGFDDVGDVVSAAYRSAFEERGRFYGDSLELLGLEFAPGIDGSAMAGTFNSVSVVSDYFVRTAHDREFALQVALNQMRLLNAGFAV